MSASFEPRLRQVMASHRPHRTTAAGARPAAVLVPFVGGDEPRLILTVRTDTVRSHRGQISFPGGAIDPADGSVAAAALREASEELGLDPAAVEVLGELDTFPTFVSGYVVTPVVGWIASPPALTPNPAEVAEVVAVPVARLSDDIRSDPGFSHGGRTYPTEAWIYEGHVIWGVTARIVRGLLSLLADAGLVPAPGGTGRSLDRPAP